MQRMPLEKNNSMATKEKHFIIHLVTLLYEKARSQTRLSEALNDFDRGKALAYHEVLYLVQECSTIINFPLENLDLETIDPDSLL